MCCHKVYVGSIKKGVACETTMGCKVTIKQCAIVNVWHVVIIHSDVIRPQEANQHAQITIYLIIWMVLVELKTLEKYDVLQIL